MTTALHMYLFSEVLAHAFVSQLSVSGDGDGELDVVLLAEGIQPVQELLDLVAAVAGNDRGQRLSMNMWVMS